ncbi:pirin family protein [Methylocystis parvus]|uniref:Pirin family protein n=1 Tax=Methylocystis parvus TaxID=134 RepID=A0A6B8LXN6_9HYPH|nr:pirin family protein [Methylocystis parvus]QGM96214.1 pirin family protein [Methylocystis parvus]WBJ99957.1 pirin family protein [Methylocystis parvus OBBP]
MRKIIGVYPPPEGMHWVGDGFPVRSLFSHHAHGASVSPFLLLDYAGPADFPPSDHRRGVGQHPHRGFETVTIVFDGEVAHRDSTGAGGTIGPGDVQWMTAGAGVVHEEYHSDAFARRGGRFELVQLWVNLPARMKMTRPRYQTLTDAAIPRIELRNDEGLVRVVAGEYAGAKGPAETATPMNIWDVRIDEGKTAAFEPPDGHNLVVAVLDGPVVVNGEGHARAGETIVFERHGGDAIFTAQGDAKLLLLSGEPIDEPVAQQGPFVMNTPEELKQAFEDYRAGRFGTIAPIGA